MDVERIAMYAGVGFALGVGAFVLWGPTPRPARRGRVSGIINLGHTCFLNSLLQSLAATATFRDWLNRRRSEGDPSSFTGNLAAVVDEINGFGEDGCGDVAPISLVTSLGSRWRFGPGHQDAHELFYAILGALGDENRTRATSRGGGCLSDALPAADSANVRFASRGVRRGDAFRPADDDEEEGRPDGRSADSRPNPRRRDGAAAIDEGPHPFRGLLTSQLRCANCERRSPVRYDRLESVSLPLPPAGEFPPWKRHELAELLERLVRSETIEDASCEACGRRCPAVKTPRLGKLPRCLCLRVPRTTRSDSGIPVKRDDPVAFPEILALDPFAFAGASGGADARATILSSEDSARVGARYRYRLAAVVEHRGPVDAGHFVRYRRDVRRGRWIYAPDATIEEATPRGVLRATPYLLFYERTDGVASRPD